MQVKMILKRWTIERNEKKQTQKITGAYSLNMGTTEVAEQTFNGEYNGMKLPFSTALMLEVEELEKKIKKEIESFLS